jgi:hypothetical protein
MGEGYAAIHGGGGGELPALGGGGGPLIFETGHGRFRFVVHQDLLLKDIYSIGSKMFLNFT